MEVKIITIHAMYNPGSVFQAYALQEYLKLEHDVKIIDYRPLYLYSEGSLLKLIAKKILWGKAYRNRNRKFIGFVEKRMNLTRKYKSFKHLKHAGLSADVFMTGSDQLWNTDHPCGKYEAVYLSFVKRGKKISYSTSVGKKNIDQDNLNRLKKMLSDFSALSVREKSTAEQLSSVLNRNVSWVCDPVLLLPASSYQQFISTKRLVNQKYAVVYILGSSESLDKVVNYYKLKGLFVVLAGGFTRRCNCDLHIKDVGPEDFLNLIYYAEIVISSSFHATAFCHIFHKNFITFLPKANGERISGLLECSGLESHSVLSGEFTDLKKIDDCIDWNAVEKKLNVYIENSKEFLKSELRK